MNLSRFKVLIVIFAIVLTGFAFATSDALAALTEAQIQSVLNLLDSFGVDQSTIDTVDAALRGEPAPPPSGGTANCNFTRSLFTGVSGSDVKCLQQYLNGAGHPVAGHPAGRGVGGQFRRSRQLRLPDRRSAVAVSEPRPAASRRRSAVHAVAAGPGSARSDRPQRRGRHPGSGDRR